MEYVLETHNIEKRYKDFKALSSVNMHIEKGAIYGLVGKNGAGKTTLIRIITGLQKPDSGSYAVYGIKYGNPAIKKSRKRMGAIIESPAVYEDMTAKDNLIIQCRLIGKPDMSEIDEILNLVGLENTGKKKARNFSLGMKQRLGIAVSLISSPDFLILDEPINGLDPKGIIEMRELILKLNREKRITILISSHYLDELSKIATHYGFLDNGRIIREISSSELEKKIKHKFVLKVDKAEDFVRYFEEKNIVYEVCDRKTINVYGNYNLAKFLNDLYKNNLYAEDVNEIDESLENYYMNLIGGSKNE